MAKHKKSAKAEAEVVEPEAVAEHEGAHLDEPHGEALIARARDRSDDNVFTRFKHWYLSHKKKSIPATVFVVLLFAFIFPASRYAVLGLFISRDYSVTVLDSVTGKPVTEADVKLAEKSATTNEKGEATIAEAPLGSQQLTVTKKHYKDASSTVTVALNDAKNKSEVKLEATGRQVTVAVVNKITEKPVQGASVTVLESEAKTDEKGEATIVVSADKILEKVTVKQTGFNDLTADLDVSSNVSGTAKLTIVPSGKVYFLSKQTGKIDVVKSNLDGSERKVVLAGTGKEQDSETILLATRDWKYLMLKSRREGERAKLYLIETGSDTVSVADEGEASFEMIGWQDHNFVFKVNRIRPATQYWWPKGQAIKSYNADKKNLTTMRESGGEGVHQWDYSQEQLNNVYLIDDVVLYDTSWVFGYNTAPINRDSKQAQLIQGKAGTSQATALKGSSAYLEGGIDSKLYAPNEIYYGFFDVTQKNTTRFYEYEHGKLEATTEVDYDTFFNKPYPRFIESPSGKQYFWAESRDGKSTFFLGDENGENAQDIGSISEFDSYGWFTDDYLLVSKKGSELHIMGKDKGATPLKITDYHKPAFNANYYGGGY